VPIGETCKHSGGVDVMADSIAKSTRLLVRSVRVQNALLVVQQMPSAYSIIVSSAVIMEPVTYLNYESVPTLGMLALMKTKNVLCKSASCGTTTDNLALEPVDAFDFRVIATLIN
jgi:hypothetical protein